jgi:predicted nucleotidyltransferase
VLALAERDERVVAAAVIGSLALGEGDDWSDLDLTFGLADTASRDDVLVDWTRELADAFDAVSLFDLDRGELIYRVLLLPAWLQVDLSFAAGAAIQARAAFRPVFGPSRPKQVEPESA